MFKNQYLNCNITQLNHKRRSRGTAATDAQRSSPPVGMNSSTGSSSAPFKPSEPRGSACSIVMHNKTEPQQNLALKNHTNTLTRSRDQQPLRTTVLPAPATTVRALPAGPPPGPAGTNLTSLGPNRGRMREHDPGESDAPRGRRTHSRRCFA
ncbi:hypothetical protein F511_39445 [Dorcoceras hygrometricum]|uniref:Uncharacterized protein n=1 Tax=Dorcoceras hygrometricum TaxID=472368 RepID=A0A2Z7BII6_9LAMI|nr:hypothetical protein F511_39445 [Dorcoceras hygrometricum]